MRKIKGIISEVSVDKEEDKLTGHCKDLIIYPDNPTGYYILQIALYLLEVHSIGKTAEILHTDHTTIITIARKLENIIHRNMNRK